MKYISSFIILFAFFNSFVLKAQSDSVLFELKKIQEKNRLLKVKDSIRAAIVKEELDNIVSPKSKELEQYKNELLKIKKEDSIRLATQKASIDQLRKKVQPHSVTLQYKHIFNVYTGLGPFSAKDRATNAEKQIQSLYDSKVYYKDSLKIQNSQEYANIVYRGDVITSVSHEDALWENISQDSLAVQYKNSINQHITEARADHRFENSALRWLMAIGIVIGFIIVARLIKRLFSWLTRKIVFNAVNETEGIKIKNYQFIDRNQLKKIVVRLLKYLHIAIFIVLFGLSVSTIFSIFPATESWAYTLIDWIWTPVKDLAKSFYDYLPKLFRIVVIIIIARYAARLLRFLALEIERGELTLRGFHADWGLPTYNLLKICLIAFTLIMIFPYLPGSDTSAFRGVSVFFGVILSLGSSSAIANTVAGFIITYMRPFKVGDWIKVNDTIGEVLEKTPLVTRLRTINNEDVTIPNSMILTNKTINYSSSTPEKGLVLNAEVFIRHEVPFATVNHLLIKAALITEGILETPKPYVLKCKITEASVQYQLNATTLMPEKMYFINSDLHENILKVFTEEGVDLVTPQYYQVPQKDR